MCTFGKINCVLYKKETIYIFWLAWLSSKQSIRFPLPVFAGFNCYVLL